MPLFPADLLYPFLRFAAKIKVLLQIFPDVTGLPQKQPDAVCEYEVPQLPSAGGSGRGGDTFTGRGGKPFPGASLRLNGGRSASGRISAAALCGITPLPEKRTADKTLCEINDCRRMQKIQKNPFTTADTLR